MAKTITPAMIKYAKKHKKGAAYSPAKEAWRRFARNKTALIGLVLLGILILVAIFATVIAPYKFEEQVISDAFQGPSSGHLFGTDNLGRDLFSRCVYGARYTLLLSVICCVLSMLTGGIIGLIAGYFGGKVDNIIMRLMDILMSIPAVLLAICIASALGKGMIQLLIAMTVSSLPMMARNVRTSILNVRTADYIEASQAIGVSRTRMLLRHMVPNAVGVLVIYIIDMVSMTIGVIASLSYIGVGLKPPAPEWGLILSDGKQFFTSFPHMVLFPALLIMIAIMAMNMLGDGLRDAFDPRLK